MPAEAAVRYDDHGLNILSRSVDVAVRIKFERDLGEAHGIEGCHCL